MRIGLVGYGTGGRHFHAPFIAAAEDVELAGVVARAPATLAKVEADLPGTPIYPSLSAMIAAGGIDAVTVTTPPQTRRALVLEAIDAGLHVIADKPFAPSAEGGRELDAAAKAKGVVLGVFHNRRFDADVQTLRKVIADGRLGRLWRVHSRMDFDDPVTLEAGPTGGLLRDLGSHLVDQILWLLGPAVSVDAQLDMVELPEGTTDAGFTITLRHESGVHSHLSASKLNRINAKEYRALRRGRQLCVVGHRRPGAGDLRRPPPGRRPCRLGKYESEEYWGTLRTSRRRGACHPPPIQGALPKLSVLRQSAKYEDEAPNETEKGRKTMTEIAHYIDNARVAGTSGKSQPVYNPATGEAEKTVALASSAEVR